MRLNRFLARSGVTSRRKAEELIITGKIQVNSKTVTDLATEIDPQKDIILLGEKNVQLPEFKYYQLNKPVGYTVTKEDRHAEKTIYELLPDDSALFPVGRLDRDSEGLIIITNDGNFAQNIIHPSKKIEKEYEVETKNPINDADLERLKKGVTLEDGLARAKSAIVQNRNKAVIIITEGRKRQIRRMFKEIGHNVILLKRIRIGDLRLDTKPGALRELTEKEIKNYV